MADSSGEKDISIKGNSRKDSLMEKEHSNSKEKFMLEYGLMEHKSKLQN